MKKTILITGSTDGIGLRTALKLAEAGHQVLLHGRSQAKIDSAVAEIGGNVESYIADLSDLADVNGLASKVRENHETLDVLINNAGVLKTPNPVLGSGQDIRFVVNTFAPFLLTEKLLPIIPKTDRVVNLSSAAQAPVNVAAMLGKGRLSDMDAYAQSKLAITIWTRELAKLLPNGPSVVAVNPGSLLASKMVKEGFGVPGNDLSIGANILIDAALGDRFAGESGAYFDNDSGRFADPHSAALNAAHSAEVMKAIKTIVG